MTIITTLYHKRIIRKHVIPYVLGVFLGCTLTIVLVCLNKLASVSQQIQTSYLQQPPTRQIAIEQKPLLYIGTLTSGHTLHSRGKTCFDTWGKEVPGRMALYCNCDVQDEGGLPVVQLPGMDM